MQGVSPSQNYIDVEKKMRQVVKEDFMGGAFFKHLLQGAYTLSQIKYFAIQYSYYSRHFPRVLGAAISAMPPVDTWWVPLADNLWDEAGRGLKGKSHEQLYKTFLFSVDPDITVDHQGVPTAPMSLAVSEAIDTFIQFFRNATPLQAMAAVGLGSEMFAGEVMGMISKGLQHPSYNQQQKLNVLFWDVHADEHEPHHYQLCKDILAQYTSPDDLNIMLDTGREIARSEAVMYAKLHEEMIRIKE
ncbi:TenA family transcriptional regulator [Alicyclobacillus sp. ALC3]|uniref:TenA family transcriptional regulator n=1 Tax=Alicyclobacillus sp. ALC3 TaxID=2796143 RepID=UPI002377DD1A|nr:iron-containing redox enzyme family protein [Alicyclobacillus sp. ALC3]WDL99227.1 iron-containing redox enzyme family protein [Alicyclobacillus sp. ALC3]